MLKRHSIWAWMYLLHTTLKIFILKMMRDEDLSGTASNFFFFMRLKQRIYTIWDKIYLHRRWIPCILSKSADPKLIWGYCLDRCSPDKYTVLAQQLKARKHILTFFFFSLFFGFTHGYVQVSDLLHNRRVDLDSLYFLLFSYYVIDTYSSILLK